jgi:2-oxoacid dehydrogenases acyltransferase (catalytic domain)
MVSAPKITLSGFGPPAADRRPADDGRGDARSSRSLPSPKDDAAPVCAMIMMPAMPASSPERAKASTLSQRVRNPAKIAPGDVVGRARGGKLRSADISGGTFTVSNLGMLGIDYFDAILNIPQVAILAVGATTQRQVWNGGDPAWRPVAELTLTCDHRAVDGTTGAGFLSTLRELLEK